MNAYMKNSNQGFNRSRRAFTFLASLALLAFLASLAAGTAQAAQTQASEKETQEERIIRLLGGVLPDFPIRIKSLKPEIRRIVFYEFRVDKNQVKPDLKRVLQSMIETEVGKVPALSMFSMPQLKPIKVVVTEDNFKLTRGLSSPEEMKEAGDRYRVDAIMEAEMYMSGNNLYVSMTITELSTGSVVWKETFFTKEAMPIVKGFNSTSDVSAGLMFFPTTRLSAAAGSTLTVGPSATYYAVELRFTEPAWPTRAMDFVLKGGAIILASGTSFVGGGYAKTGLRFGIINKPVTEEEALMGRNSWLSLETNFGVVFPTGDPSSISVGGQLEMDITRKFSFGAGLSYFFPITATVSGDKIQVGGAVIELLALKYYF